jgi:hypothetical protein
MKVLNELQKIETKAIDIYQKRLMKIQQAMTDKEIKKQLRDFVFGKTDVSPFEDINIEYDSAYSEFQEKIQASADKIKKNRKK